MNPLRFRWPVLLLAALLAVYAAPKDAYSQGPRVAVFPIKNNGQAQYNGLASGLSAMITTNLSKSEGLEVVEPQKVLGALTRARLTGGAPSVDDALKAASGLGAEYAVTGTFLMFGGKFRVDVAVYGVAGGESRFTDKAQAAEQDFFDEIDKLSNRIIIKLAGSLPRAKGGLTVESDPPGAEITLDGEEAGTTAAVIEKLEPGPHTVEIDLYGYQPYSETVTVVEGETAAVKAVLIPLNGGIRVWWMTIPTSDVQVGGDVVSVSSFLFSELTPPRKYCRNLPAGNYRVSARLPYKAETSWDIKRTWKTFSEDVEIRPGEVTDVYIKNDLFAPAMEVTTCGTCAASWDFTTDVVWFEDVNEGGIQPRPFD